jgi:hypothetical protein
MKIFSTLFLFVALSSRAGSPTLEGRNANYFYFELVPGEKIVLTLQADRICKGNTDKISISNFESTASYPSTESKGNVSVRVKSIFVESFSPCSNHPIGKLEEQLIIGPYTKQMTHIRLITSDGIKVLREGDCGMVPPGGSFDKNCKLISGPKPPSR